MGATIERGADDLVGAGDIITYSVEVTNIGNTCLEDITVIDDLNTSLGCHPTYAGAYFRSSGRLSV